MCQQSSGGSCTQSELTHRRWLPGPRVGAGALCDSTLKHRSQPETQVLSGGQLVNSKEGLEVQLVHVTTVTTFCHHPGPGQIPLPPSLAQSLAKAQGLQTCPAAWQPRGKKQTHPQQQAGLYMGKPRLLAGVASCQTLDEL